MTVITDSIRAACLAEEKSHGEQTGHWDKDRGRIKQTGEVFTPTELVLEVLEQMPDEVWEDGKTYLDPACGNGQFLSAVAIIKRELGHKSVLSSIYGVDLMPDNVRETQNRLLAIVGNTSKDLSIVNDNILCKNGLEYDYSFGVSPTETLFDW